MKLNWNSKYTTVCIYIFLTAAACICFAELVENFPVLVDGIKSFFDTISPFVYGFIIAYLLCPIAEKFQVLFEKNAKKRRDKDKANSKESSANSGCSTKQSKTVGFLSIVATYIVFLIILTVVFGVLVPQIVVSISEIGANFTNYTHSAVVWLEGILDKLNLDDVATLSNGFFGLTLGDIETFLNGVMELFNKYSPSVISFLEGLVTEFMNILVGVIISVYMLAARKNFAGLVKKILYAFVPQKGVEKICLVAKEADECFGKYINGQIIDSVIVGVIWFLVAFVAGIPYPFLISVIIGITNMIPFFGPFIGGIPSAILVFLAKPQLTVLFVVLLVVIQQLDGNLLAPRIIGQATGVSPFWVIFAILVMGDYFGIPGLVVAVPLFALVYREIKNIIEARLEKKGLPTETNAYIDK